MKPLPKEVLRLRRLRAVLFDMDGTMVNNHLYHKNAWKKFARRHGVCLTDTEFKLNALGKHNNEILPTILGRELSNEEIKQFADEKEAIYREMYAPHVKAVEGLHGFIRQLKARCIKVAVTTVAQKKNIWFILESLVLTDQFDAIVGEDDFKRGKPDPELFLKGAEKLGVKPEQCIVFEDTPLGNKAARRARMKVGGLLTCYAKDDLKDADFAIDNYAQLEIKE